MRHRKAEAVAAGDDDVPILWHCRIQFLDNRTRVERARGRRIGFGAQCLTGPYRVPNVQITSTALLTNKTPSGTYRAPCRYEGSCFFERLIELCALDLG